MEEEVFLIKYTFLKRIITNSRILPKLTTHYTITDNDIVRMKLNRIHAYRFELRTYAQFYFRKGRIAE